MASPYPRVIDVSHHQTIPGDLKELKASGVIGLIHKMTEGASYTDDKVAARYYLAKEAGLAWGIYHFMRPGNMAQQAQFFLDQARQLGVIDEQTMLVADHEDAEVSGGELKDFLDAVEDMSGRSPVVYSGHILKEQLAGSGYRPKRRLWLAQYSATPTLPEGVDSYYLWQYSEDGEVAGIDPPTDVNFFEGSDEDFLKAWAGSKIPQPEPVPQLVVKIEAPPGVVFEINGQRIDQ